MEILFSVRSISVFRGTLHSLNHSEQSIGSNGEVICNTPKCLTIYTTLDAPLQSIEKIKIQKHKYKSVGLFQFKSEELDSYVELEYPAINILALTPEQLDELEGTPLEILKVLYLYKYQKSHKLLLQDDIPKLLVDIERIINKYNGEDYDTLSNIFIKLKEDAKNILKAKSKEDENYGKVLENVINLQDYPELAFVLKLKAESKAEGKAEGRAEAEAEAKAEIARLTAELEEMSKKLND